MPSTYSPDLRIELIANGEQSGTWGTTTNTNLGTLIEDAIAGYVSVSVISANQALTANNGAADQARNMIVNLTTTTLANFNVYVPPANKFYVIRNSSAYQATIYCSTVIGNTTAAGTGIAIPAGRETIVFADGTNVVSAIDYAPSLVLGAALPVASGGTGITSFGTGVATWLGTPSSANLRAAVTDETGSGALVFATSPTLVTPALGTPASGNLANCTFPTLNQNTTGTAAGLSATLVATSGGTGQSSYAVGDLLFASTTTALSKLADVATGNALISGGVGVAPSYGKVGLTTHVSGTLPVANGGTGRTTSTAYAVVCGGTTTTGALQSVASVGTAGQVLTSNGASALPTFQEVLPTGIITMWSGTIATIPSGWFLCNGSNGTPDLRDKFIIGARQDDAGTAKTNITGSLTQTGGSKDAITVSHTHTTVSAGDHQHFTVNSSAFNTGLSASTTIAREEISGTNNDYSLVGQTSGANVGLTSTAGAHTHTINSTGSSGTNANLVPYFALAFIMKA